MTGCCGRWFTTAGEAAEGARTWAQFDALRRTHATPEESEVREFRESDGWVLSLKPLERCRGLGIAVEHKLANRDGVVSRWLGLLKERL
jgi:hypothetical protein